MQTQSETPKNLAPCCEDAAASDSQRSDAAASCCQTELPPVAYQESCCGTATVTACCGTPEEPAVQPVACSEEQATPSCCGDNAVESSAPCCSSSQSALPTWRCGTIETPVGPIPQVATAWSSDDVWGQIKARTTAMRMQYTVNPGLYAVGTPDAASDVLVSANYKLSFDILRRELNGLNVWMLVLDTKGINVWCAAGKGTFGTEELARRIRESQLDKVVSHTRVIVPQLGAPGVSAALVKKHTGFRVLFGPVEARDIPAYLQAGYTATPKMRRITFPLTARLVLTPMEIVPVLKKYPLYALAILIIFGLQPTGILFSDAWRGGWPFLIAGFLAILAGTFFTPALLPFIPFRSFAVKGWIAGLAVMLLAHLTGMIQMNSLLLTVVLYVLFPLLASYIALQFTGSTPFTGISGVQKELKIGIPVYLAGAGLAAVLIIIEKVLQWV